MMENTMKKLFLTFLVSISFVFSACADNNSSQELSVTNLFENDRLTVYRYKLPKGGFVGPHTHEGNEMEIMISSTEGTAIAADGSEFAFALAPGDINWVPELKEPHQFINDGGDAEWFVVELK